MSRNKMLSTLLGLLVPTVIFLGCQAQPEAEQDSEGMSASDAKQELVEFVTSAAAAVEERGEEAFADFRQADSEWFKGDRYVFVIDLEGNSLCHPTRPDLEGTNLSAVTDSAGVSPVEKMLATLENSDSGWMSYMWAKPGMTEPAQKSSYVMKVMFGDTPVAVGSGIYTE